MSNNDVSDDEVEQLAANPDAEYEGALAAAPPVDARACKSDILYIGDVGANVSDPSDDVIAMFDAATGDFLGYVEDPVVSTLNGPRGLLVEGNRLLVAEQNTGEGVSGGVLSYNLSGAAPKVLVEETDVFGAPPWAPRGMVLDDHVLYVADFGDASVDIRGSITLWNSKTGKFLVELDAPADLDFQPRGIVIGPDGNIYVTTPKVIDGASQLSTLGGAILRFDGETGEFLNVVYDCDVPAGTEPTCLFHRPEGIVFGPDGRLYVSSFRADPSDIDRILVLEIDEEGEGIVVETIPLDSADGFRSFAQVILFGPAGLYVPITSDDPALVGTVRVYDVSGEGFGTYTTLVDVDSYPEGVTPLARPQYLTFGGTDPTTLAYVPKNKLCG